jgi:hypothetical protein
MAQVDTKTGIIGADELDIAMDPSVVLNRRLLVSKDLASLPTYLDFWRT